MVANLESQPELDHSDRYAANWPDTCAKAHLAVGGYRTSTDRLIKGYCCFPGCWKRSVEVHHSVYRDRDGPIAGREIPGVHVFPLCNGHHSRSPGGAHHWSNWTTGKEPPPALDAQNSAEFYLLLRNGWIEKRQWAKNNAKE